MLCGAVAESGLAAIAIKTAIRHGLVFRRADRDGFRWAPLGQESAEVPVSTRQQIAEIAIQVGRDVLPDDVHESFLGGRVTSPVRVNHIGTTRIVQ